MGIETVALASLVVSTTAAGANVYQARKQSKIQERVGRIQQQTQLAENRKELVQQTARARILAARARAAEGAIGAGGSGTEGATSGLASTLAGSIGEVNTRRIQGNRLTKLSEDLGDSQVNQAIASGIGSISGGVFNVTGGSLFD